MSVLSLEVILGGLTFTGSLMAAGKATGGEVYSSAPRHIQRPKFRQPCDAGGRGRDRGSAGAESGHAVLFPVMVGISLLFGIMLIVPIGGADMPTVISLLNSYAGLSAAAMGFVLNSKLLIVAGALDGSSGFILSVIMSKAMNRSFTNVLFGAFGQVQAAAAGAAEAKTGTERDGGRGCRDFGGGEQGGHRSGLRHGRGAGPAQGARALRRPDQAGRGRDDSGSIPLRAACRDT